jgi:hypothetical protein
MRRFWGSRSAQRWWWLVVAIMAATTVATRGQTPVRTDTVFGLRLPAQIGGAERGAVKDYETTMPGLGYGVAYRLPGWTVDIYIYDLKLSSIPDDPTSTVAAEALAQAKNEVVGIGERGDYRNVVLRSDYTIRDAAGRTRFVCAMFTYHHVQLKKDVDSYLCLTAWKGKFVKFRMTTPRNDASSAVSRRFIEAWSGVLWPQG